MGFKCSGILVCILGERRHNLACASFSEESAIQDTIMDYVPFQQEESGILRFQGYASSQEGQLDYLTLPL